MSAKIARERVEIGAGATTGDDLDATYAAYREENADPNGRTAPTSSARSVMDQLYDYFSNTPGCGGGGLGLGAFSGFANLFGGVEELAVEPEIMEDSVEAPETGSLYAWKTDLKNHEVKLFSAGQKVAIFAELARQMENGIRFDNGGLNKCVEFAEAQPAAVTVDQVLAMRAFGVLRLIRQLETRDVLDVLYEATHDEVLAEDNPARKAVYTILIQQRALCAICRPKGEATEYLLVDLLPFHGRGAALMSFRTVDSMIEYCQRYFESFNTEDDKGRRKKGQTSSKYKALVLSAAVTYQTDLAAVQQFEKPGLNERAKDVAQGKGNTGKSSMANRVLTQAYGLGEDN